MKYKRFIFKMRQLAEHVDAAMEMEFVVIAIDFDKACAGADEFIESMNKFAGYKRLPTGVPVVEAVFKGYKS